MAPLLATGAPVERLADLFSLFHFWLAGFAAYLLLRDLDSGGPASLFGGIAWMLSARMVQTAIWPNAVAACALLPLLLLGILRIGRGRRSSGVAWAAISGGLLVLSGRPHAVVGAFPLIAAAAGVAALGPARKTAWRDLLLAAVLAAALGGPALAPTAAQYSETSRSGGLSDRDRNVGSIRARNLDQVFLPVDGPPLWPEAAAYPGVLAAAAVAFGLALAIRRAPDFSRRLFLALLAGGAAGLAFSFGDRGPYALFSRLPLLSGFRVPARFLISWSLALALAGALAVGWCLRRAPRPRGPLLGLAVLAVLSIDLVWHARRAAPTAPTEVLAAEPPLAAELRPLLAPDETGSPRRFWSLAAIPTTAVFPTRESVEESRRRDPLPLARGMRFALESVQGAGPTLLRIEELFAAPTERAAQLGGAGALVLAPPPGDPRPFVVRPFTGLPRLFLVPEAIVVPPERAVAAALDGRLDPRRTAVLEAGDGEPLSFSASPASVAAAQPFAGRVRVTGRRPGFVAADADSAGEAILVVLDAYERGWSATVDGRPAPVLRADGAFLGVRLAPGRHAVRLTYALPWLREGFGLLIAGALGLVVAARRLRLPAPVSPPA